MLKRALFFSTPYCLSLRDGHAQLTREVKGELLRVLFADTRFDKVVRPLEVGLTFSASSLARCFAGTQKKIAFPLLE